LSIFCFFIFFFCFFFSELWPLSATLFCLARLFQPALGSGSPAAFGGRLDAAGRGEAESSSWPGNGK
jgi:hypothetical protein